MRHGAALPMVTNTGHSSPRKQLHFVYVTIVPQFAAIQFTHIYSHYLVKWHTLRKQIANQLMCLQATLQARASRCSHVLVTQQLLPIDRTQALRSVTAGPLKATTIKSSKKTKQEAYNRWNNEKPRYYMILNYLIL